METQKKMREIEIDLDMKIDLVENAFSMMAKYELHVNHSEYKRYFHLVGVEESNLV